MGAGDAGATSRQPSEDLDALIRELREKHHRNLQHTTLTTEPLRTLKFFIIASVQYLKQSLLYVPSKGGCLVLFSILVVAFGFLLMAGHGPHEKEIADYFQFGLWWVALGVASSIGLGSGLHTFVLYLGPHIAFFTAKAVQCGRVDLKTAPYDTIQLKSGPSWLGKDCSEFGPPIYSSLPGSRVRVPISSVLPQVQLEAVLWGIGTALGELPPYFISRAARLSGSKLEAMEELDAASSKDGFLSFRVKKIKHWLFSHSQHLNFFTILTLASVPNPLFDLAGIMCGQFGIPFWKFFFATLTGKAFIKTHIQAIFIISVCNNQLLEFVENRLIWGLGLVPGFPSMPPNVIAKLHKAKEKYLSAPFPAPSASDVKVKQWNLSFTFIWNTILWLMLMNYLIKIVNGTAQQYLKKLQDLELASKLSELKQLNTEANCICASI